MKNSVPALDRLLRAAATAPNEQRMEMPLGFDTRLLAQLRENSGRDSFDISHLLRRVVLISLAVLAIAGAGAYRELNQPFDPGELGPDDYAIADSAIGLAFDQ